MVKLRLKFSALFFLLLFALQASAYTVQYADKAKTLRLRWKTGTINLALSKSLKNPSPLATVTAKNGIVEALEKSLDHWKAVAGVDFILTWTDKTTVSPAGVRGDGTSLITIADTPDNILFFEGEPETAAKTRVFFNGKGQITEGDIVLNPYQLFSDDETTGTFDLESVLTHEIGHLLGLGHSEITGATMQGHHAQNGVYSLSVSAFRTLSEDDIAGVRALYGANPGEENCCGALEGKLLFGKEKAVKDLLVWLEDAATGRIISGTASDQNGHWNLEGLAAGRYFVYAQSRPDLGEAKIKRALSGGLLGAVNIETRQTTVFEKAFALKPRKLSLDYFGFNAQLSTLAIPVNEGKSYLIYIADRSLQKGDFELSFNSPYFEITPESLRPRGDFSGDINGYSFEVKVAPETPPGEYSLRIKNGEGNVFYLVGALTVEPGVQNFWVSNFLPEVNQ